MMRRRDTRQIKDIICNGYIYVLVKGRKDRIGPEPHFMGHQNWALQAVFKMKRERKNKKS